MLPKKQKGRHPAGVVAFVFLSPIAFLGNSFSECTTLAFYRFIVFLLRFLLFFGNFGNFFSNGRMLLTGEVPGL